MPVNPAPREWQGALNNGTYYLGPELINGQKIRMEVHTYNEKKTTYNTIGIIYGKEEPGKIKIKVLYL